MIDKRQKWNPLLADYPNSNKVNSVSIMAETLFTRLVAACDDRGNYDGCPTLILCGLFSKRYKKGQITGVEVEQIRNELVTATLTTLYRVGSETYIHVNNCKKFLRKDIKPDIRYPDLTEGVEINTLNEIVTNPLRTRNENVSSDSTTESTTDTTTESKAKKHLSKESETPEGQVEILKRLGREDLICQIQTA